MKKLIIILLLLTSSYFSFGQSSSQASLDNELTFQIIGEDSLSKLEDVSSQVIVFIAYNNKCPFAKRYAERINKSSSAFDKKVQFYAFEVPMLGSVLKQDSTTFTPLSNQISRLSSNSQILSKLIPERTPEVIVYSRYNGSYKIIYEGAIDDDAHRLNDVKKHYLNFAIRQGLAKNLDFAKVESEGCRVSKK